ncbi:unnamed protein product [Rangifer tarandus platyrhynchus]|uniref:Uncharacterized protein n=1 Tax=Rangifer tarandus platyrhynchus TaxID=3082113 RepID=A0AC59Y521_RANTA
MERKKALNLPPTVFSLLTVPLDLKKESVSCSVGEGNGNPLQPGKSHGRRSLIGCSPWGHEESDTTEQLHFYFSLSCTGEGNGNPLQCSCLENPRDGGAWWAAVYGVAQSRTRLKLLSSSNSSCSVTSNFIVTPWTVACQARLFIVFSRPL